MDSEEDYTMECENHAGDAFAVLAKLQEQRAFTDVTLHCGGRCILAHRVVLAACSSYFETVLSQVVRSSAPAAGRGHVAIVLKDAPADLVEVAVSFMYTGVAQVPSEKLDEFLALAESLEIRGLKSQSSPTADGSTSPRSGGRSSSPPEVGAGRVVASVESRNTRKPASVPPRPASALKRKAPSESKCEASIASAHPPPNGDVPVPVARPRSVGKKQRRDGDGTSAVDEPEQPAEDGLVGDDVSGAADEAEASEFHVNDSYPTEFEEHIPGGILVETIERDTAYVWRAQRQAPGPSGGHSRRIVYFCSRCGFNTGVHRDATRHEQSHFRKRLEYVCQTCGEGFRAKYALRAHVAAEHHDDVPAEAVSDA